MTKIYITVGICAVVFGAYWAGGRIARESCRADVVVTQNDATTKIQNDLLKTKGDINAEANNTGAADIRGCLRAKYTIAD